MRQEGSGWRNAHLKPLPALPASKNGQKSRCPLDWGSIYDTLFAEVHTSPSEVSDVFKAIIKDAKPRINWAHLALGELARQNWISTTITTNFDLLALEGYARAGVIPVVSDGLESLNRIDPNPDQPQLLQVNGSVHSYRLRNSPADLEKLKDDPSAITCFRNLFQASRLLVVVGYEGREPQIMHLLTEAAKTYPDKHIFWCLYSPDPAKLSPRAAEFLSFSTNARLIPGQDADLFFHSLSAELGIGAPLALRDPLAFLEQRLEGVYPADRPEHGAIKADITALRDRIARLKASETASPLPAPEVKPAESGRRKRPKPADTAIPNVSVTQSGDPTARFEVLDKAYDAALETGRDKGIPQDLETAIALAKAQLDLPLNPDQRGTALNNLGRALWTLGEREAGTARLEAAVAAFADALEVRARDRVPLDWAKAKMNLGNALSSLGRRETKTTRLEAAVAAYTEALEVRTRDRVPLDWAMTKMNLGNALLTLGEREAGTARLESAVASYIDALEVWTRDRAPLDWATAKMNLGNALSTLGQREAGTARLGAAVAAFTDALQVWTRDRVPMDWALTQVNLASLHIDFFDKTNDAANLATARTHALAAREVYVDAAATHYVGLADNILALIKDREA